MLPLRQDANRLIYMIYSKFSFFIQLLISLQWQNLNYYLLAQEALALGEAIGT